MTPEAFIRFRSKDDGERMNVFLDDYRPCPRGFVHAKNAEECIALLKLGGVELLSLDHDLGWGQQTGVDVVMQIVSGGLFARDIYLHTSSPTGRMNMYRMLVEYGRAGMTVHNGPMPPEVLARAERDSAR